MTLDERIGRYLAACEPAVSGQGGHKTTFRVACALWNGFSLSVEQTVQWLEYYNRKCEPPWSETDLRHKARQAKAKAANHQHPRGYLLGDGNDKGVHVAPGIEDEEHSSGSHEPQPQYDEAYAAAYAAPYEGIVTGNWFEARSLKTCHNRTPAGFLHVVFEPRETVFVTADYYTDSLSERAWLFRNPDPLTDIPLGLDCLDFLRHGYGDVWYLNNPVSGYAHCDPRFKLGVSHRCLENLTGWQHLVIETDVVESDRWLAILAQLPVPIKAIYHSGKRGYHALARIAAGSLEEARAVIASLSPELIRLGACPYSLTPHRLTRLPNCMRTWTDDHGKEHKVLQRLIFLHPHPSIRPICSLEAHAWHLGVPPP